MEILVESTVPREYSESRLDIYLANRFNYKSRTSWRREINGGKILYNGTITRNHHKKLKCGDRIKYEGMSYIEPDVDRNISILHEDDDIIAVNKTGNLPVHPAGIFLFNTLQTILDDKLGIRTRPMHRLDRETSGVIIFAKNRKTASAIQTRFTDVKKSYTAIVHGEPEADEFENRLPIGPARNSPVRKKREAYPGAPESAHTLFTKIKTFSGYSLIEARPVTGRQHQIRVHLNSLGLPIAGDKLYGSDDNLYLRFLEEGNSPELISILEMKRCALHSSVIEFTHPGTTGRIRIEAPLASDMKAFILEKGGKL